MSEASKALNGGAGTVFDETKFVARCAGSNAIAATNGLNVASNRFFPLIAIVLLELFVLAPRGVAESFLVAQGLTAGLFVAMGLFASRLNKTALIAGMAALGADTLYVAYTGWNSSCSICAMLIRLMILCRIYLAYQILFDPA